MYDKNPVQFIKNALSPARDVEVFIKDLKKKEAIAVVNPDNLSLAIGKKGINIKFYVVPFISEGTASSTPASGGNTDTEHTAAETDDYLNNLLNGGDDGYNNDDVDNYLNNLINGGNDGYNNDDVDNYFSGLMTG